jgi:hypothetical protein
LTGPVHVVPPMIAKFFQDVKRPDVCILHGETWLAK